MPEIPVRPGHAIVILFRKSGKYYTQEDWRIPEKANGPYDMIHSPDFRRIDGGAVLVDTQEPWGFPHLFPAPEATREQISARLFEEAHGQRSPKRPDENPTDFAMRLVRAEILSEAGHIALRMP